MSEQEQMSENEDMEMEGGASKKSQKKGSGSKTTKKSMKAGKKANSKTTKAASKSAKKEKGRFFKMVDEKTKSSSGRYVGDTPKQAASKGYTKYLQRLKAQKKAYS